MKELGDGFGAEADRIPGDFREVWDAFFAAQVLVFRNQKFSAGGFLEFARQFGRPEPHVIDQFHHPEHADILILSNVQKDGQPIGNVFTLREGTKTYLFVISGLFVRDAESWQKLAGKKLDNLARYEIKT